MHYTQLTDKERYNIEFLLQAGYKQKDISKKLFRSRSTISRELKRNSISDRYNASLAIGFSRERCKSKREHFKHITGFVHDKISDRLTDKWTPEQISSYLKLEYGISVSHEQIYQYINNDRHLGGKLYLKLPHRGKKYKKRNIKMRKKFPNGAEKRRPISECPSKDVLKRQIGHWEGDMVEGKGHRSGLGTFVDIKTKFVVIRKLNSKSSQEMKDVINKNFRRCPELISSLILDNGREFALHGDISRKLSTDVYFADPYAPWQRGLNENTNMLIRRFFPKGTDFNKISEREVQKVQNLINSRPRKTLGFKKPRDLFIKEVMLNNKFRAML